VGARPRSTSHARCKWSQRRHRNSNTLCSSRLRAPTWKKNTCRADTASSTRVSSRSPDTDITRILNFRFVRTWGQRVYISCSACSNCYISKAWWGYFQSSILREQLKCKSRHQKSISTLFETDENFELKFVSQALEQL
jgi:hypothetical protein